MLRTMRGAAETWIIKVLMVFLVISFSIWGVGDIFKGNPQQRIVACVGGVYIPLSFLFGSSAAFCSGEAITVGMLNEEFTRLFEIERNKNGPDYTSAKAKQRGLLDRALRETAARILFNHTAEEFRLRYNSQAVLSQIANMPELRTKDGHFDKDSFERVLRNMRMTESAFIDFMRDDFARNQSIGTFSMLATAPQTLYDQILRAQGQEYLTQVLRLPHDRMPLPTTPPNDALEKFYQDNLKLFTAPEYRDFSVMRIVLDDIAKTLAVSDADVATAFEKRKDEFAHGELRDILQVVLPDEAQAAAIVKAAQAKGDLRMAAAEAKQDAVTLEAQSEKTIPSDLYTTVFSADLNAIGDPVKSDFGYHVIQVTKITPPYQPVLAEVKDKLRQALQRELAQEAIQDLANRADDDLAAGKSLEDIAAANHFLLEKHAMLDHDGYGKNGTKTDFPAHGIILQNAFGLNDGEASALLDDHRGNYLVVRVDRITPSQPSPYAEIKDKALKAWQHAQQAQSAAEQADKIRAEWQQNPQAFADLGKRAPLTGKEAAPLSLLGGLSNDMPRPMQPDVLKMKPGDIILGTDSKAHYIVRLTGYRAFDPAKNTEAQASVKNQLEKGWRADVLDMFETALRAQYPVRINSGVLDSMRQTDDDKIAYE